MTVAELIKQIRQTKPKLLEGIPEDTAEAIIQGVFSYINGMLAAAEEGVIEIAQLGEFRIKQVEREVQGETVVRKRIAFVIKGAAEGRKVGGGGRRNREEDADDI